jgi:hypothetical protein
MPHKVLVTFSDGMWNIVKKQVSKMGLSEPETVRTMVTWYLEDKAKVDEEIHSQFATHEIMIGALVQILQEKGVISFEDWENRVSAQVE